MIKKMIKVILKSPIEKIISNSKVLDVLWDFGLSNPDVWLDPTDNSTITLSGVKVTSWGNKGLAGGAFTQNTFSQQPELDIQNGKQYMAHTNSILVMNQLDNGAKTFMNFQERLSAVVSVAPSLYRLSFEAYMYVRMDNPNQGFRVTKEEAGTVVGADSTGRWNSGDEKFSTQAGGGFLVFQPVSFNPPMFDNLFFIQYDDQNPASIPETWNLRGIHTSTGNSGDFLTWTGDLDNETRQKCEGRFAWKYGKQNSLIVPVGHPFKLEPPFSNVNYVLDVNGNITVDVNGLPVRA